MKTRDTVVLLCCGRGIEYPPLQSRCSGLGAAGGDGECGAEERAGSAEQINGCVAEPSGYRARRRGRQAVADVEERNERPHRAATIGRQHTFQGLHPECWEDQRAAEACDKRTGERDNLVTSAP